jgi:hypothetical protein
MIIKFYFMSSLVPYRTTLKNSFLINWIIFCIFEEFKIYRKNSRWIIINVESPFDQQWPMRTIFTFTLINTLWGKYLLKNSLVWLLRKIFQNKKIHMKSVGTQNLLALSNTSQSDHRLISTNFNFFRGARLFCVLLFQSSRK